MQDGPAKRSENISNSPAFSNEFSFLLERPEPWATKTARSGVYHTTCRSLIQVPAELCTFIDRCAISKNEVMEPYFFGDVTVTGSIYKIFLWYFLNGTVENYPLKMIFDQNGVPPHYAILIRQYLEQPFSERRMGMGKPTAWPAQSPQVTTCTSFLWRLLTNQVFLKIPQNISEPKTKFRLAVEDHTC